MAQIKIQSRPTIKQVEKAITSAFGLLDFSTQYVTKKDVYFFLGGISNGYMENTIVKIACSRSADATWLDIGAFCEPKRAEDILLKIKNKIENENT